MTNPPTDFLKYIGTPFQPYILPIIPAGAKLRPDSALTPDHLGKIPGKFYPEPKEWSGFWKWQTNAATRAMIERWQHWQDPDQAGVSIALGLWTGVLIAFDVDINNRRVAESLINVIIATLGRPGAIRRRHGSSRAVLFYLHQDHTMPITKARLEFKILSSTEDDRPAVEVLGQGQQVVAEGPHAKGAMHYWQDGIGLIEGVEALKANRITIHDVDLVMKALKMRISDDPDLEQVKMQLPTARDRAAAVSITALMSPHRVTGEDGMDLLKRAVEAIDLNSPLLSDYQTWINLLRAIKAACGGDDAFFTDTVLPWLEGNAGNTEKGVEWLEERWNSFTDSQLGAEYVFEVAYSFGFKEGSDEYKYQLAKEAFGSRDPVVQQPSGSPEGTASPDGRAAETGGVGGGQAGIQSGVDGSFRPGDGGAGPNAANGSGGGPTPFPYTDRALAGIAAGRLNDRRYSIDLGWVRLESGVWVKDPTILQPISDLCAEIGQPYRAQGKEGAQIDLVLNGSRKHQTVELAMRHHPAFFARKEDFDADPWLLNTPRGIWDIRTGTMSAHGPLMRMQTAFAPDMFAYNHYDTACPDWMAYLKFVADGRDWVIPFLQRWGGYNFVGLVIGPHFLFIHGAPGSGKTVFVDVILRALLEYGTPVSKQFFIRGSNDKRTFELYQLAKKRAAIADETPKGSTWDEMMILTMHNGSVLRAEGKGRDFIDFRNTATVTITGNHKPSFVTSAEESGIDRRLLVLTMNKKIAEHMPDNERFAEQLMEREGPGIMMWFMQGALEGWESLRDTGSFLGNLAELVQGGGAPVPPPGQPVPAVDRGGDGDRPG